MTTYADTSFLVSCYVPDKNSPESKRVLSAISSTLPFTALHALEVRNAFKLGVFRGHIKAPDADAAWRNVELDLRAGRLVRTAVRWPLVFRVAATLAARYSETEGTRSLDVLHVATAKAMRIREILSFDTKQRALSSTIGMRVQP